MSLSNLPASDGELLAEVKTLSSLVGELTVTLVVQGAYLSALKNRRARPADTDLDEAIASVRDSVPGHVAASLQAARDSLLARFRDHA